MSEPQKRWTVPMLAEARAAGRKLVMLTSYDASFARVLDDNGVDLILIGDSLGMVVQGFDSTLPVRVDDIVYHTAAVARGATRALKIADFPFGSDASPQEAHAAAVRFIQAGARWSSWKAPATSSRRSAILVEREIPGMCAPGPDPAIGARFGGFKVQGREDAAAAKLREDALAVADAGAALLVLEGVPAALAAQITAASPIPTIGIGAGAGCDGQVLVLHDLLGLDTGHRKPKFVKDFLAEGGSVAGCDPCLCRCGARRPFPRRPNTPTPDAIAERAHMIETITELESLRSRIRGWKRDGLRVGFVPTMGNLHAGHYSLVALAASTPTGGLQRVRQSDPVRPERGLHPLSAHPGCRHQRPAVRRLRRAVAAGRGIDVSVRRGPGGQRARARRQRGAGRRASPRPFRRRVHRGQPAVQPGAAGRGGVRQEGLPATGGDPADGRRPAFPIEIVGGEIVREANGLAMSSRNQYLSPQEREVSAIIHHTLHAMRDGLLAGLPRAQVEADADEALRDAGFVPDYAVVRRPDLTEPMDGEAGDLVALIAARLGRTRLIDNLEFHLAG
jgi:3-methyl-2-oxobutanoate hydroxymethyltransferase